MPSVKMKTTSCGPLGNRFAGKAYPVDAEEGRALVAGGFAEWVEAPPRRSDTPVEVAVAPVTEQVENAARSTGRRRRS